MDHSGELFLKIKKETSWQQTLSFYKELSRVMKQNYTDLTIEFEGEKGSDAGARNFQMMLRNLNNESFEGKKT